MPRRFSNLSLLRRWLPDAPLVFAKASECTLLLNLQPPYACGAATIRPASGFLKSILQSDFVCFKFLIGTRAAVNLVWEHDADTAVWPRDFIVAPPPAQHYFGVDLIASPTALTIASMSASLWSVVTDHFSDGGGGSASSVE